MPKRRWRWTTESVTALGAVFTAFVALAVGVWDNVESRRHNRLSVVPHVSLTTTLNTSQTDSAHVGLLTVRNEGVGPAIIRSVRIRVRDDDYRDQEFETWGEARGAIERILDVKVTGRAELEDGSVLGTGRQLDLVTVETTGPIPRVRVGDGHPFGRLLMRLSVQIHYESVYGDRYEETTGSI